MQYTSTVIDYIDLDGDIEDFMYAGLFGKGPSKYPSKIESDIDNPYITYDLNSKGLVEREKTDYPSGYNSTETYSYDNLPQASASVSNHNVGVDKPRHINSRNHNRISFFGRKK